MATFEDTLKAHSFVLASPKCIVAEDTFEVWQVLEASTTGQALKYFLYLKSDATPSNTAPRVRVAARVFRDAPLHAILPPSHRLLESKAKIKTDFGVSTVQTTTQFLSRPHEDLFKKVRNTLIGDSNDAVKAPTFIQPNVDGIENPLVHFAEWLLSAPLSKDTDNASVLLGDGGIGKTYFARHLETHIWRTSQSDQPIPLLLESRHWHDIDSNRKITFMDICRRALIDRNLLPLATPLTFRAHWESGLFAVILDGFDELCANRVGPFNPSNLLKELHKLTATPGGSRIILTSRTSYWHQSLDKDLASGFTAFKLRGFGNSQRTEYLRKELIRGRDITTAKGMVRSLELAFYGNRPMPAASERITGLPYVLWLVARLVKEGVLADHAKEVQRESDRDPLIRVLSFICRREQKRQGFAATSEQQLAFLGDLSVRCGPVFSGEEIEFCAHEVASEAFADSSSRMRLRNHILLRKNPDGDGFEFALPMIRERLQARTMANQWKNPMYKQHIMTRLGDSMQGDTAMLEGLVQDLKEQDWKARVKECLLNAEQRSPCSSGLWHLADLLVKSQVRDRKRRPTEVLGLFGDFGKRTIHGIRLSGRISNCDFRSVRFERCHLERVEFCGCKFDDKSAFVGCQLIGDIAFAPDCHGREAIQVSDASHGTVSSDSLLCLLRDQIRNASERIDDGVVKRVMEELLGRFCWSNSFVPQEVEAIDRFVNEHGWLFERAKCALMANGVLVRRKGNRDVEVSQREMDGVREFLESGAGFGAIGKAVAACLRSVLTGDTVRNGGLP